MLAKSSTTASQGTVRDEKGGGREGKDKTYDRVRSCFGTSHCCSNKKLILFDKRLGWEGVDEIESEKEVDDSG